MTPTGNASPTAPSARANARQQHTYAGHVWLAASPGGDVLAVFEATAKPALAVIAGRGTGEPRRRGRNRRPAEAGDRSPDGHWEVLVHGDNLVLRDPKSAKDQERQLTFDANPNSTYARDAEADRAIEMNYDSPDPETPTPEIYWAPDAKHFVAMRLQPGTRRARLSH